MPTDRSTEVLAALESARSNSIHAIDFWLDSHRAGLGGLLVVQASWRGPKPRDLIEAAYRTESWTYLL